MFNKFSAPIRTINSSISQLTNQLPVTSKSYQISIIALIQVHKFIIMRSLYTDDILGTKPRLTIIDKSYFRAKHDQEIMRSPRNPDKSHQYEWFKPLPHADKPEYTRQPYRNTIKLISQHTGLSHSMHYQSLKKHNNDSQPERHRYNSVLSNSGLSLLKKSKITVNQGNNPYYPHKIRQSYDKSNSTRFTGNRNWNSVPNTEIRLPDPKSEYISKWVRI